MPTRKERQVIRTRNTIIAVVAAIVILVLGYGTLYSTGVTEGEYQAGTHYEIIEEAKGRRPGEPIQVREFFSYGCIHCKNFDPLIEDWQETLPDGVEFTRTPVAFSPVWSLLGRTYVTLDELDALDDNHDRLFRAIHDNGRQFLSPEMIADFVDGYGVSREAFLREFDSPAVRSRMRQAERDQTELGIRAVPTLVVDDKYRVGMDVGRKVALDVVDHIIAMERAEEG
ncbi:MAG: thioredoxin domain-containing protein [Gammaproteobacteria bacterium]|jgi:thiol:disulfide interchange protein DsbA|nr:thioredoxin domain-containing protein [Gammaproteobacteria bacterium]